MRPGLPTAGIQFQASWNIGAILGQQLGTLAYLHVPQAAPSEGGRIFVDNASIWQAVLSEHVRAEMSVKLESFLLLEWFPRSPGLFHTPAALEARRDAMAYIDPRYDRRGLGDHTLVLLPEGKFSMLQGGVGCIRLKPIALKDRVFWLMTATSNGVAHEGFPVAVPRQLYERHIAHIAERGALCCVIVGRLKFLPRPVSHLLDEYPGVPRLYLEVEDIIQQDEVREVHAEPEVSVAASFVSSYEGRPGIYATYVTFEPGSPGSFLRSIDWLKQSYVEQLYKGHILTDFDQTKTHFPEAALSLRRVMNHQLRKGAISETIELMHATGNPAYLLESLDLNEFAGAEGSIARTKVFISYSRQDRSWLERLRVFLRPLTRDANLDVWDDTRLAPGSEWAAELDSAIESARVAILLITADFMASDFIQAQELPKLLKAAERRELTVLPVFIGISAASDDPRLTRFEAVNDPKKPVKALSESDQDAVFDRVRQSVRQILNAA
jgi:hypothetical protein